LARTNEWARVAVSTNQASSSLTFRDDQRPGASARHNLAKLLLDGAAETRRYLWARSTAGPTRRRNSATGTLLADVPRTRDARTVTARLTCSIEVDGDASE
jgi:hypothetical protein